LAAHYARAQNQADMKSTLQRLLDDPKNFPQARLWIGDFYVKLRDYQEAIHSYDDGAANDSKNKMVYRKRTTNALLAQGKDGEAFRVVEQILKEDAQDRDALRVHADLLLKSGRAENVDKAEHELLTLSKLTPSDAGVWLGLGEAKRLSGDLEAARANYLTALRTRQDYLPARYGLAEIGLLTQRPQDAQQQTDEILKVRPGDNRARLLHAKSLIGTDLAAARAELTVLAKASPQDLEPQFELGVVALNARSYEEARAIFSKLQGSGDPRAIAGLAETYLYQKQFEKAFQILDVGFKKRPDSPLIHQQYAKAAALTGRYDLAVTEFQKLISVEPKSLDTRLLLAELYERKGDRNNAILTYRQAEQMSPTDLRVGLALAEALTQAGRISEARTQYDKLVQSRPDNPAVLNNAAFFLSDTGGNLDKALTLAQRALAKAPGQPGLSDTIGYVYLKKGQRDSAIQTFSNLVRKYPGYATFRYHLGLALFEKGDKIGARKELEAALAYHPAQQDAQRIRELLDKIS